MRDFAAVETATARTYVSEQDGRWRFIWRMFQTQYSGPLDLSGQWYDLPDYGPPPGVPPLDEATFDGSGTGAKAAG